MNRYNIYKDREVVLLQGFPCSYGKCSFCTYKADNSNNIKEMIINNKKVLENVTGKFSKLEVINSGTIFDLPLETLLDIDKITTEKNISTIQFEIYYEQKDKLQHIRNLFKSKKLEIITGIETFDNEFRNTILNKKFKLRQNDIEELPNIFYSICLMIGMQGQTQDQIYNDIIIAYNIMPHITINIYQDNGSKIKADEELKDWCRKTFKYLQNDSKIDWFDSPLDIGINGKGGEFE